MVRQVSPRLLWETGIPRNLPAVCCEITRPITNMGDVKAPASRLYSSQAEQAWPTQNTGRTPMHVSIRIKGYLDPGWQGWLEGLQIMHEPDGTSRLTGTLKDQPALYGVLTKISHLSLTLLSLESREPAHNEG
jgi:hypothetical protein